MHTRIMGMETEYGITCVNSAGEQAFPAEEAARRLFHPVVKWARSSNVFLPNASRLYLDVGSHPEYATCECQSVWDLVAQARAGDRILSDLVAEANQQLAAENLDARIYLFKNNVDAEGNSFGSHENYLVDRRGEFTRLPEILVPFLITRQIVTGAGGIVDNQFVFSRRSDYLYEAVSSATTRTRPIINTRDEPHADETKYRRLHVISGDSTMSDLSTYLRFASTSAVLELIESGAPINAPVFEEPMAAIRDISRDLTVRQKYAVRGGRDLSALEIQQFYFDQVAKYLPETDSFLLNQWQLALDALRSQDFSKVETRLDWAIKYRLFEQVKARRQLAWDAPEMQRLELAFHDISSQGGLQEKLIASQRMETFVSEQQIKTAVDFPPADTRAKIRGDFIRAATGAGVDYQADWKSLKLNRPGARTIMLSDPFARENANVNQLISDLEKTEPLFSEGPLV